ncbi:hypothetical protein ACE193_18100 [Bernardetia sp. OM2101]|uniref:hypothetical protein n=1 Tax=Bernardetia sp. OM2101 TaxID=3344876 RepID=UPI0035D0534E
MKTTFTLIAFFILSLSFAQNDTKKTDSTSHISVKDLTFMIGTWEGEGWIMKSKTKQEFIQKETIRPSLDSTILIIDGLGHDKKDTTKIIHEAFGVISLNAESKLIEMLSFSKANGKMETPILFLGEGKLQWSFKDERGGTIRFSEDFSEDGLWVEKGEYSFDGKNWFNFFEMKLNRVE